MPSHLLQMFSIAGRALKACLPGLIKSDRATFFAVRDCIAMVANLGEERVTEALRASIIELRAAYQAGGDGEWRPTAAHGPVLAALVLQRCGDSPGAHRKEEPLPERLEEEPVEDGAEQASAKPAPADESAEQAPQRARPPSRKPKAAAT